MFFFTLLTEKHPETHSKKGLKTKKSVTAKVGGWVWGFANVATAGSADLLFCRPLVSTWSIARGHMAPGAPLPAAQVTKCKGAKNKKNSTERRG
jgi:hypothetical protein